MGPRATATGSSQAAYLAKPVGRDRRVVEKMTGITPVAFTCRKGREVKPGSLTA